MILSYMAIIRPYRSQDRADVYEICIRTAHLGGDASEIYQDPRILPEIFAGPYVHLEPELAFVVEDGDRAVGYIVGTSDTGRFVTRFRQEWLPQVATAYPALTREPVTPDEIMVHLLHTPERMVVPELVKYPAHLHIDLLPGYQRAGHGRELMENFTRALRYAGTPAVHLGMVTENVNARPFYDRLGFHVIHVPHAAPLTYLGLHLT